MKKHKRIIIEVCEYCGEELDEDTGNCPECSKVFAPLSDCQTEADRMGERVYEN